MKFVNLHTHSEGSIQDGIVSISEYIKKTKEIGQNCLCISDHGNMNSYAELWKQCKKNDLKPIFAVEFYYIDCLDKWQKKYIKSQELKGEEKKEANKKLRKYYHLILIAKNENGLKNLFKLIYESNKNFYYKPRLDKKLIEQHSKDLICSTACMANKIPQLILQKKHNKALKESKWFQFIFKNDFYLEIQFNEMEEQNYVNKYLCIISKKIKAKLIIGVDSHYLNKEDYETHKTLLLMQGKKTYADLQDENKKTWEFSTKELFYKSYEDVKDSWRRFDPFVSEIDFREACKNTVEVANKIEQIELDTSFKLKDTRPDIYNKDLYIKKECIKKLKEKKLYNQKYVNRLKYELSIIKEKGYSNYFVFIQNIIDEMKKKMLIGPGRGSGAGSIVCYLLGITAVDPVKYNLLFERFLDLNRIDPPDLDLDFEDNDYVKNYLLEKYNEEAACISSYSTYKISQLIKDLGKTYNIENFSYFNEMTKEIKKDLDDLKDEEGEEINIDDYNFDDLFNNSKTLQNFLKIYPFFERDLKILLGKIRHIGKHAAGVVVCDDLIKKQPIIISDGIRQTVLEEGGHSHILADMGFIKVDILGLKTLQVIHQTIKLSKNKKLYKEIEPDNINLQDKKVYDFIFKKQNVCGIFQMDTDGAKKMIKIVKPESIEELSAINALNRPGPMKSGMSFEYAKLKKDLKKRNYFNNQTIKKILESTYSILTYQEQQMQIMNQVGGIDLVTTNKVRKWFAKKMADKPEIKEELEQIKKKFLFGCKKNKIKKEDGETIWERMYNFAKYSFNLSHSLCYSFLGYTCSYLKTYYPIEFYTSLLNVFPKEKISNGKKINFYEEVILEAQKNGFTINKIDINNSEMNFSMDKKNIFWGFSKVKGIGNKAAEEIIRERNENGKFKGFQDFLKRKINWRIVNKTVIESLIFLGCFNFKKNIGEIFLLEFYLEFNSQKGKYRKKEFPSDFFKKILKKTKENLAKKENKDYYLTDVEKSKIELKAYDFNLEYSPFEIKDRQKKIQYLIQKKNIKKINESKSDLKTVCLIKEVSERKDRKNQIMAFIEVMDFGNNKIRGLIFSSNYNSEKPIKIGKVYVLIGEIQDSLDRGKSFIINNYFDIDSILN